MKKILIFSFGMVRKMTTQNKIFITIIFLVTFCIGTNAQLMFQKSYGGGAEQIRSIQQTFDGGYIIAGGADSLSSIPMVPDLYIIRTDSTGDTLWTKVFGDLNSWEWGFRAIQTNDSGFIVIG